MGNRIVMLLEISNATDEQIQADMGKAFADFCKKHNGTGITASILTDEAVKKVNRVLRAKESD